MTPAILCYERRAAGEERGARRHAETDGAGIASCLSIDARCLLDAERVREQECVCVHAHIGSGPCMHKKFHWNKALPLVLSPGATTVRKWS